MTRKYKVYRRILIIALIINILGIGVTAYVQLLHKIPDDLRIVVNENELINLSLKTGGIFGEIFKEKEDMEESIGVLSVNNQKLDEDSIKLNLNKPFSMQSSGTGSYTIKVKLLGIIDLKEIQVDVIEDRQLIPCGMPIGISIRTNGVLVLGTGVITGRDGLNYEPALNILKTGDYILEANGRTIDDKSTLMDEVQKARGSQVDLTVKREDEVMHLNITPVTDSSGDYKIGAWIRDDTQGIGTLTYMDEEGCFGALGHGITDIDTGVLMDIKEGNIYKANILQIIKGKAGTPGEIVGVINKSQSSYYGDVNKNTRQGIFGQFTEQMKEKIEGQALPIGLKQGVKTGKAQIMCQLRDKVETYDIEIEKIEWNTSNASKGMVIHITDEKLLDKTNGIIQGMSGSPIIQDGKIIGAVTHVFVQDSTRGYGIFIENMLHASR